MKKRSQIADKYKWNLDDIYPNFEALTEDIKKMSTYPEILSKYKGKLRKEKVCLEFFEKCNELSKISDKVEVYISLCAV